jgi:branched-chain amino acid transport system ATP-binding protein
MLKVSNLDVSYGNHHVLKGISLEVAEGELVAIVGSNGSGKSTLLMALSGIIRHTAGEVDFLGTNLNKYAADSIFKLGLIQVCQGGGLFPDMSVLENLKQGAYRSPATTNFNQKLEEIYTYFPKLAERKSQRAGTLSGGERQMLAIGRALMGSPRLLMLDEPSSGLSPLIVQNLMETVDNLHKKGMTTLLVEQNAHLSLEIADRGCVLENGQIVLSGRASELLGNEQVKKAYMGA